ncbi:MAG: DKNYY domain-containing protein [Chitinophagaceae bacterium]
MSKFLIYAGNALLLVSVLLLLISCGTGYEEKNGKISFNGKEITDPHFIILNDAFAKDSQYAYYKEKSIENADISSFEAVDLFYAKDKNRVYYCDEFRDGKNYYLTKYQVIELVEHAIPASFRGIEAGYATDGRNGFYKNHLFAVKDIGTLKGIDEFFAKDTIQVYFNRKPVAGSDGQTFEIIDDRYAKDKQHIYYYGHKGETKDGIDVLPADRTSFRVLAYPYSRDSTRIFFENVTVAGADAATFTLLEYGYAKDKTAVYLNSKKLADADPATFELFKENASLTQDYYYAKDKNNVYWLNTIVKDANPQRFAVLGHGYGRDSEHIFYKTSSLKNAEIKTFEVYPHDVGNADAADATGKYHDGKKLAPED